MTTYSIDELITALTTDEVKSSIYTILDSLGISTTSWQPGAPTRTIIAVLSQMFAAKEAVTVEAVKGMSLELSPALDSGLPSQWLKNNAIEVYGVTPIEAEFASNDVVFTNAGGGVFGPFAPGDVVVSNSTNDKTYVNTEIFSLLALGTATVNMQAQEIGTDSNAAIGQIDGLVTTLPLVSVTNLVPFAGTDGETSDELKQRCRDSRGALSPNGPRSAYDYVAKTPTLNGGVSITRVRVLPPPGDGTQTVVIANAAGIVSAPNVALVQIGIDAHATPEVATVTVVSATAVPLTYVVNLYVSTRAGISSSAWQTLVKDALVNYVPTIPIGGVVIPPASGKVLWRAILGTVEALSPYVLQATLGAEVDTALTLSQVATLDAANVTVNVTQVTT
jgi:hypothetical protein